MTKKVENIPNAATLINSMRSIGYDFESAVSDIIDNSITAKANNIDLLFPVGSDDVIYLQIIDDGYGMNRNELIEAMRFGSVKENDRDKDDLGRFGLGLKTASISQCRKFTVISKKNSEISGFVWDLDLIGKENNWEMIELSLLDFLAIPNYASIVNLKSFTLVLWEKLDKLDQEINLFNNINDVFSRKLTNAEKHISLIFHRFIEEGLSITLNYRRVSPLDPFLSRHPKTDSKVEQLINTKTSQGKDEKVKMQVHVLPYHKDFSNEDYDKIGGYENIDNQGFYIYRNKRLMLYGTWFRIRPKAELSRNARIRVDIPNTLDDLWSIDIKKQKAIIPSRLLEQLKGEVASAVEKSKRLHEYKGNVQTKTGSIWNKLIDERENSVRYEINQSSDLLSNLFDNLDEKNINLVKKIFNLVELSLPYKDIYNSVSEKKNINVIDDLQTDAILSQAITLFNDFKNKRNLSALEIIDIICDYEPFLSANIKNELKEIVNG